MPEGEITDVSQLPSNIPAYLARVIPELSLNGDVFLTDSAMSLGNEINLTYQLSGPLTTYAPYNYSVVAGSYLNVPLIAQVVSPFKLANVIEKLDETVSYIEERVEPEISEITRNELIGDRYYYGGLAYFTQYAGLGFLNASAFHAEHKLEFGYGSFGYEPKQDTFFGIPRSIGVGTISMNIRLANIVEGGSKELNQKLKFVTGIISSAMEHTIPEQMFNDELSSSESVSAVKALQIAMSSGQKIYQIDEGNLFSLESNLNLDMEVENEIRSAALAGKLVITHTKNIEIEGWSGSGYLILGPETMIGSYKISGGRNGSDYIGAALGLIDGYFGTKLDKLELMSFGDTDAIKKLRSVLKGSLVGALALFGINVYNTVLDDGIPDVLKAGFIAVDILAAALGAWLGAILVTGGAGALLTGLALFFALYVIALIVNYIKLKLIDFITRYRKTNYLHKIMFT